MPRKHKKETLLHLIGRIVLIIIGAIMAAGSIELFLLPSSIIDGGIIGISLILNNLTNINFGILVFIINLPFLYFGYKFIGNKFLLSSLIGIITLSLGETYLHHLHLPAFTTSPLLATVFGGVFLGAGVGIVIRYGGALDGTEILGILFSKKFPFSVGEFVMLFNVFVFAWAGYVLGAEQAMYSIITYFIAAKTIDVVIQGIDETKAVLIVSDYYDELADAITSELGRGITMLSGKGGFKNDKKEILYVVVTRLEVMTLKNIVTDIDKKAFITIMNTQEAHGSTFKSGVH
ncbi:YitT family protein [Alkalicoccobacillus plakortidis]|uniref:YitT family protein n=1 Tax=Alkalicoccobacillus plakortidis TaxID=444060 RepID=A0ABT0XEX9_9BACI|nr:YitT family protein [Alkalicoccobacillus plakortidis]MCM2674452.1 YitT family protein [Alkalicoccobacillus plakortidis]